MNTKVEINGDTGVAVNAEDGAIINIHVANVPENKPDPIKRAAHVLLKTCGETNCQPVIERISQVLYGTTIFKDLGVNELAKLQNIAAEFNVALQTQKQDSHAVFTKEMNEYEEFFRRTGIRAAKQEREALTRLMADFHPGQIKKVWLGNVLDYENDRLRITIPVLEPLLGGVAAALSALGLALLALKLILIKQPISQVGYDALQFVLFCVALILAATTLIAPTYIGKRIKAKLDAAQH